MIHVHEMEKYLDAVYIGRGNPRLKLRKSKWHNPFRITEHLDRADVIEGFDQYIRRGSGVHLQEHLGELTGKPLACWCRRSDQLRAPETECHGDVLIDLWHEMVGRDG